jgi:hypothetical protein
MLVQPVNDKVKTMLDRADGGVVSSCLASVSAVQSTSMSMTS